MDEYAINVSTYNSTVGKQYEYLRIIRQKMFDPKVDLYDTEHRLGQILLLIMETVPLLKKWDSRTESIIDAASINNKYFEKLRNVYCKNTETLELFDLFLFPLYRVNYTFGMGDIDKYDSEQNALKSIYNYITLCIENKTFYDIDYLLILASSTKLRFTSPEIALESKNKGDMQHLRQLSVSDLTKLFNKKANYFRFHSYEYHCLSDICFSSLYELISSEIYIKKCENCGRWFIEYSKNEKYCDEPCKQAARKMKESIRLNKESNRLLKNLRQMLYVAGKQEELSELKARAKEWRINIRNGQASEEEFIEWLKSKYKRKYKN